MSACLNSPTGEHIWGYSPDHAPTRVCYGCYEVEDNNPTVSVPEKVLRSRLNQALRDEVLMGYRFNEWSNDELREYVIQVALGTM